jgi:G:T-mismatch repair DNA endonuclease (very short patch repair protein)
MTYVRESTVENHLIKVAKAHGFRVRKLVWVGRRGAPDRVLMKKPGVIIFVELKAPKGVIEDHQIREHKRLRDDGFRVAVLWSKEAIDEYFK